MSIFLALPLHVCSQIYGNVLEQADSDEVIVSDHRIDGDNNAISRSSSSTGAATTTSILNIGDGIGAIPLKIRISGTHPDGNAAIAIDIGRIISILVEQNGHATTQELADAVTVQLDAKKTDEESNTIRYFNWMPSRGGNCPELQQFIPDQITINDEVLWRKTAATVGEVDEKRPADIQLRQSVSETHVCGDSDEVD